MALHEQKRAGREDQAPNTGRDVFDTGPGGDNGGQGNVLLKMLKDPKVNPRKRRKTRGNGKWC